MTEKVQTLLHSFLDDLPESDRAFFRELAEHAISLGYMPRKTKSKDFALDFMKSKVSRTLMKMEVHDNAIRRNGPGLRLKFYASDSYSTIFRNGVQRVIEEFNGRYAGCYGCGRCKNGLEGYTFTYPDGRKVFRCGGELLSIHRFTEGDLAEFKQLMSAQDAFFMSQFPSRA